jgi:peptidoglycan pentaglycine glycine transferase (the first glycine)
VFWFLHPSVTVSQADDWHAPRVIATSARSRRLWTPRGGPSAEPVDAPALKNDDNAWDRFVAAAAAPSFLQSTRWALVKRANGWISTRVIAQAPGGPVGAQLLVRHLGPLRIGLGYAARGPLAPAPLDPDALAAFTVAARTEARKVGASHVRIDPEVEDPDGAIAEALLGLGWAPAREIQPAMTRTLDLVQEEGAIWLGIHRKWRQSIRKGGRDGTVIVPAGAERLADFHRIHAGTMARVGLPVRSLASFESLYAAFAADDRAHLSFTESPEAGTTSTILLLGWGDRVVDLYGGTTDAGRRLRANYVIKWEAIRAAKAAGYHLYDLWGLPSERVAGFKAGWGGRVAHYIGAWDLVVDPLGHRLFETLVAARARWLRLRGRRAASLDAA